METFTWLGLTLLIKVIGAIFFGFIGGVSLAAGFDFFKTLKMKFTSKRRSEKQKQKNQSFIDGLTKEVLASQEV